MKTEVLTNETNSKLLFIKFNSDLKEELKNYMSPKEIEDLEILCNNKDIKALELLDKVSEDISQTIKSAFGLSKQNYHSIHFGPLHSMGYSRTTIEESYNKNLQMKKLNQGGTTPMEETKEVKEYSIVKEGDTRLRNHNQEITDFTKTANLAKRMFGIMNRANGCGLAAPQIGINIKMFVVDLGGKEPEVVMNPVVTIPEGTQYEIEEEGCLSVPDAWYEVKRPTEIIVSYKGIISTAGKTPVIITKTKKLEGKYARRFLHEFDHLESKLISDAEVGLKKIPKTA